MISPVRDKDILNELTVFKLHAYARSHNWHETSRWHDKAIVYTLDNSSSNDKILLPIRNTFADYAERVANAIYTFAEVEHRSELDVYYDLLEVGVDIIWLSSSHHNDGYVLSLNEYSELYSNASALLTAAARSVEAPKAVHRGKISSEIVRYLAEVIPARSESKTYALTLHSPVTQSLYEPRLTEERSHYPRELPFSRRTTLLLADALDNTNAALNHIDTYDVVTAVCAAVGKGISANLCNAISCLAREAHGINITISWAGVNGTKRPQAMNSEAIQPTY